LAADVGLRAYPLSFRVNSAGFEVRVTAHRSLLSVLREDLGFTGPKEGCDDSECGACMVLLDGLPLNSCSYLALQCNGCAVTTVEGLAVGSKLHVLQQAIVDAGGVQCGFCTPGMLISAVALLNRVREPDELQVRHALAGNLCRCTGYQKIVQAVLSAASTLAAAPMSQRRITGF